MKQFKINRLTKKLLMMQRSRMHNQSSDDVLKKEKEGYHQLAVLYTALIGHKKHPFAREASLAAYRASAMIDDMQAQYLLGKILLDEAKLRESWQSGLFASQANAHRMTELYEDAHAFLDSASKAMHIEAKRLKGLCYINAWGVPEDKTKGFQLVVESIQQENSWDRVPQIFASIGLNKPEFFTALAQAKKVK